MARPRFEKTDPAKQEVILEAAAKEFARYGYEAASVNRIVEAAGLSKGAFYYYFDDKADLATAVTLWASRPQLELSKKLTTPTDRESFWRIFEEYVREGVRELQRSPLSNQVLSRLGSAYLKHRELADRVMQTVAQPMAAYSAFMKRGQELGAVRSDLPVEVLFRVTSGIKESLLRVYLPDGHVMTAQELTQFTETALDLWRRVCAPTQEAPR